MRNSLPSGVVCISPDIFCHSMGNPLQHAFPRHGWLVGGKLVWFSLCHRCCPLTFTPFAGCKMNSCTLTLMTTGAFWHNWPTARASWPGTPTKLKGNLPNKKREKTKYLPGSAQLKQLLKVTASHINICTLKSKIPLVCQLKIGKCCCRC